jgi:molecular chaperone DnaK
VKGSDKIEEIEAAAKEVEAASHSMAEKMYQRAQQQQAGAADAEPPAGAGPQQGGEKRDEVVDADYTVVDDEKDGEKK